MVDLFALRIVNVMDQSRSPAMQCAHQETTESHDVQVANKKVLGILEYGNFLKHDEQVYHTIM